MYFDLDTLVLDVRYALRGLVANSAFALGTGLAETSLVFLPSLAVSALHVRAATASFLLLPVVVLFFFAQRAFVEGISLTGIKG